MIIAGRGGKTARRSRSLTEPWAQSDQRFRTRQAHKPRGLKSSSVQEIVPLTLTIVFHESGTQGAGRQLGLKPAGFEPPWLLCFPRPNGNE